MILLILYGLDSTERITHTIIYFSVSMINMTLQIFNNLILGIHTSNFTATSKLFTDNEEIHYWRFEAVYYFPFATSSSALNFHINQPPQNGTCSINSLKGTTSTPFNITCSNWNDTDGV